MELKLCIKYIYVIYQGTRLLCSLRYRSSWVFIAAKYWLPDNCQKRVMHVICLWPLASREARIGQVIPIKFLQVVNCNHYRIVRALRALVIDYWTLNIAHCRLYAVTLFSPRGLDTITTNSTSVPLGVAVVRTQERTWTSCLLTGSMLLIVITRIDGLEQTKCCWLVNGWPSTWRLSVLFISRFILV